MAVPQLTSSDVGASARDKINAAIALLNTLPDAINDRVRDLQDLVLRAESAVADLVVAEAATRTTAVGALSDRIDALTARGDDVLRFVRQPTRLAVYPGAFGTAALGGIGAPPPLDGAGIMPTPFGPAYRLEGAGLVAPRFPVEVDPDAIWVLRARYWRLADVLDPNNDALDIGIQWLDPAGGDAGTTLLLRERDLRVADGPRVLVRRVPSLSGETLPIVPPRAAVAWRPYLRTYGADGSTAVADLGVQDATYAGVYAPDVSAIAADLRTIQGQIAAGLPFATPVLPSYAVADLPGPGARGRKAFARDGRAPTAAGVLEPPNAGTGVEVTDNGVAWVISGTNQQVQA